MGIPNEMWKYGGEGIEGWVWRFCSRVELLRELWRGKDGRNSGRKA